VPDEEWIKTLEDGRRVKFPDLVAELVRLKVDVTRTGRGAARE